MNTNTKTILCAFLPAILIGILVQSFYSLNESYGWVNVPGLWQDTVNKSPQKGRPRINLANALMKDRRFDEALREFQNARLLAEQSGISETERRRTRQFAGSNVIAILMERNQWEAASEEASALWNEFPGHPGAGFAIAFLTITGGEPEYALKILDLVEEALPKYRWFHTNGEIHFLRGTAYEKLNDCVTAETHYRLARTTDPDLTNIPPCKGVLNGKSL